MDGGSAGLHRVLAKVLAPRGVSARGAFGPYASFPLPSTPPALGPWGLLACGWGLLLVDFGPWVGFLVLLGSA